MNCPTCSEALSERGSFCKFCGGQARCLQCKELLEPAAKACVECGTLISHGKVAGEVNRVQNPEPVLAANRNTIRYGEDRNSRDLFADLSDNSMQSVGDILAEALSHRNNPRIHQQGSHPFSKEHHVIDPSNGLAPPPELEAASSPQNSPTASTPPAPELQRLSEIFRPNGEALELIENRLKAKTGMDYVRRLTYLFLYAHEVHGRPWTAKACLITVLKEAKVWDTNAATWLKAKKGLRADAEENLQLIQGAREDAKKVLTESLDTSVTDGWNPDKKTPIKRSPRKKKT